MKPIQAMWAALLRAGRTLLSGIAVAVRGTKRMVSWLFVGLFGRWQWQAPAWFPWVRERGARGRRYLAAHPIHAALLAVVLVSAGAGSYWYANRPRPHYVTYAVESPGLTE